MPPIYLFLVANTGIPYWFLAIWVLAALSGLVKPAWQYFQKYRASSWPSTEARITATDVQEKKNFLGLNKTSGQNGYVAEITYTYSIGGVSQYGQYRKESGSRGEAQELVRDLIDKSVMTHYNPNQPAQSSLVEESLAEAQRSRPPAPPEVLDQDSMIPEWTLPFVWFFAGLSLLGLIVSICFHIGSLLGMEMPVEVWILHVGIFVVWFPAVIVSQRRVKNTGRKDFWKAALKGAPVWMRYMIYAFFAYAFISFMLFAGNIPSGKHPAKVNDPRIVRAFSGHWLIFYSAAFGILYAAAVGSRLRCINGHALSPNQTACPVCGQPASLGP